MSNILVGTSSWTDKSLIECGRFYPPSVTTPEERLRFYASQFPIVEIDSSYYGIPTEVARLKDVVRPALHLIMHGGMDVVL